MKVLSIARIDTDPLFVLLKWTSVANARLGRNKFGFNKFKKKCRN